MDFYNSINLKFNQVIDNRIADTWGYTLNAFYTVWMVDEKVEYFKVLKPFKSLKKSLVEINGIKGLDLWGVKMVTLMQLKVGLISTINARFFSQKWIDSEIQVLFKMQNNSGIIEGWHGDGNFLEQH